jgi:DNA invertase Pin-like site-specific DNA recombinase
MKVGYARVSTKEQNLDRQIKSLEAEGVVKIYMEKISGKAEKRPELEKMLSELCRGDEVIVAELTRVSRSTIDLINIVNSVGDMGASIKSLKESWLDTSTAHGKLLLTIFAGLAEFERNLLVERVKEGMAVAKEKGVHLGRPKIKRTKIDDAVDMYLSGRYTVPEIVIKTGVSKSTLYRRLRERNLM